ncbi:hypothetical protein FJR04_05260 [Anabaena sp. UHCC 0204]|nr:hypothetical protein [Anabaena sp. UHCC 0204]
MLVVSCQLSVVSCQLSVVNCQFKRCINLCFRRAVVSCPLSIVNCQLSIIKLPPFPLVTKQPKI